MGCDIHVFVESNSGFGWESFGGRIGVGRHYVLFGLLGGVRGLDEPIVVPRGLPDDMDDQVTAKHLTCDDLHTHSWLTRRELKGVIKRLREICDEDEAEDDVSAEWDAILAAMKVLERAGRKVRIVFAFDS